MAKFKYKARDREGKEIEGVQEAPSLVVLQEVLKEKNLLFISAKKKSGFNIATFSIGKPVKSKEVVIFARQLSVLINATVPIVRALRILVKQTESKAFQAVITNIADTVDGGARLSVAMHNHEKVFDDFFVYMIRAGETTGRLDEVLAYLADQKEKDYKLVSKIIGSMIYPVFIVVVLVVIFIFMMIFVIPKLLEVITETGKELPLATKVLVFISGALTNYWWLLLIITVVIGVVYVWASRRVAGKRTIDMVKLYIPVAGNIFRKVYLARISRSLANLLAAGVPVNQSMVIVSDIVSNYQFKNILRKAVEDIESGRSIAQSMGASKQIPPMMAQMISIGEETGKLDEILEKIADFYSDEVTAATDALVSLIEPMIFILLGGGAMVLVTGVMMPIYSLSSG